MIFNPDGLRAKLAADLEQMLVRSRRDIMLFVLAAVLLMAVGFVGGYYLSVG